MTSHPHFSRHFTSLLITLQSLSRLDGLYNHPSLPPPPAWTWSVTSETRCDSDDAVGLEELVVVARALKGLCDGTAPIAGPAANAPAPAAGAAYSTPTKQAISAAAANTYKPIAPADGGGSGGRRSPVIGGSGSSASGPELSVTLALPLPAEAPCVLRIGPFRADGRALASEEGQLLVAQKPPSDSGNGESLTPVETEAVPGSVARLAALLKRAPATTAAAAAAVGSLSPSGGAIGGSSLPCTRTIIRMLERRPALVEVTRTGSGGFLGLSKVTSVVARGAVSLDCLLTSCAVTASVPLYPPHLLPPAAADSMGSGGGGGGSELSASAAPVTAVPPALCGSSQPANSSAAVGGDPSAASAAQKRRLSSASEKAAGSAVTSGPCGLLALSLRAHAPARDPALRTIERRTPVVTHWPELQSQSNAIAAVATPAVIPNKQPTQISTAASPASAPVISTPPAAVGSSVSPPVSAPETSSSSASPAAPSSLLPPVPPLDLDIDDSGPDNSKLCGADDIGYYVSFDAINAESERCQAQLARLKAAAPSPSSAAVVADAVSELEGRVGMLQLAAFTLQQRVETGQLGLPEYLATVKAALARDLGVARELKSRGRTEAAAFVVGRAKVMSAELKGAEEAAAANEGEGPG